MSLEILKPPTDTLYKFVAILGLLFFLSSLVTPVFLSKQLGELKIEHMRELEVFVLDTKESTEATKFLLRLASEQHKAHKQLEQASHDYIDGKIPKAGFRLFLERSVTLSTEYEARNAIIQKTVLEWQKQSADMKYKADIVKNADAATQRLINLSAIGLFAGLVMSTFGFILWYRRTQRFEDLLLKKKFESKEPT